MKKSVYTIAGLDTVHLTQLVLNGSITLPEIRSAIESVIALTRLKTHTIERGKK